MVEERRFRCWGVMQRGRIGFRSASSIFRWVKADEKFDADRFADGLAEGVLNRLVRAQVIKGATTREKGKLVYQIRIENASPMILNGLALLGTDSPARTRSRSF